MTTFDGNSRHSWSTITLFGAGISSSSADRKWFKMRENISDFWNNVLAMTWKLFLTNCYCLQIPWKGYNFKYIECTWVEVPTRLSCSRVDAWSVFVLVSSRRIALLDGTRKYIELLNRDIRGIGVEFKSSWNFTIEKSTVPLLLSYHNGRRQRRKTPNFL